MDERSSSKLVFGIRSNNFDAKYTPRLRGKLRLLRSKLGLFYEATIIVWYLTTSSKLIYRTSQFVIIWNVLTSLVSWVYGFGFNHLHTAKQELVVNYNYISIRKINWVNFDIYQVYKYEMRISGDRWCTRAICAIKIWHCAILLCHQQASDW